MQQNLLQHLLCPISKKEFEIEVIKKSQRNYAETTVEVIDEGILWAGTICYPIIDGIPRLLVESIIDYSNFLKENIVDFEKVKQKIMTEYGDIISFALAKNKRTKESFALEWSLFNYEQDSVWNASKGELVERFLKETNETNVSIKNKLILDAGCGNGLLDELIANEGATVIACDFSSSIVRAYKKNENINAFFIQADIEFLPFKESIFDIVHCSGVIVCTRNTKDSFEKLIPFTKSKGKLSIWLYHPRKDFIHNFILFIRKFSSKLPLKLQFFLYSIFIFPPTYIIKKIKGNSQNPREMMIDILDGFTPEFRWEYTENQATKWYIDNNFNNIKVTTNEMFGFNIVACKE